VSILSIAITTEIQLCKVDVNMYALFYKGFATKRRLR